ncbi:hypothetical protein FSP39_014938 [Pinctada imbricata]|uniref:Reverse transcriptase domain-containing protein n=1 Tax=Pinctada imbricata TaxID=66713 RepID=A0AA89C1V1_PINIB|nr:hypothetical protein FSP39_014938 [Pinctada imbricata]
MPFGMKNAPATFQRMIHSLLIHLEGCEAYIDDVIIYSDTWNDHLRIMRTFFDILAKANLTVNLAKSEFCHATVEYLGHKVGQGFVTPIMAKVEAISKFPIPTNKKEIMRFLGMAGFYRKCCPNFSSVVGPLTNLLQKRVNFAWTNDCDESFKKIKCVLMNSPVLSAPNFDKQFKLTVDASDVGIGAALFQENDDGVDRVVWTVNLNKKDYYGKTPLYWAAYKGHITCVEELLKFGAKVNTTCCHGDTPLLAVCSIHAQCALLLIKHGADVNHENSWGVTPMYLAACKGQTEVIRYLLDAGAKPTFRKRKTGEIPKELLVHSDFCSNLIGLSENPMSLQHTCRSVIRKQLGENPMSKVRSLQIPQKLQDYISLTEIG